MGRGYVLVPLSVVFVVCLGWIIGILKLIKEDDILKYIFWSHCWLALIAGAALILAFSVCVFLLARKIVAAIAKSGIKHISLKDIELDLSDDKPDFKQLIDFLIEYFRVTRRKIVAFEDLDRYKNPKIFEELNNLNQAINHSEYFKKEKDKVKFVYLTSGKIFRKAADKNKVFDAIIPMIPFMSASNAEYLFEEELKSRGVDCVPAVEVIGTISDLVTDMRVLKSIANRFALYWKVFNLKDSRDEDCKDCASLSVIAELCPAEFDKLTRNESVLDMIRIAGETQKSEDITKIEGDHSIRGLVLDDIVKIRQKVFEQINETETKPMRVVVGNSRSDNINADLIMALLDNSKLDMIIVFPNTYGSERQKTVKNADIEQIVEEVNPLIADRGLAKEKIRLDIIRKTEERILSLGLKRNEEEVTEPIRRLIESELISEAYVDFVSKKTNTVPKRDYITDFLTNAIRRRDKKYGYSYPIEYCSEDILSKLRDSDYLSVGILNYDLFDSLYKALRAELRMNRIIKFASIHKREFIDFSVAYLERCARSMPMTSENNYAVRMFQELVGKRFWAFC